jgi:hypothetical protein
MIKLRFIQIIALAWCISSCNGQAGKEASCTQKFKSARDLAYGNPERKSALDSALILANELTQCDSIRKAVVDFKIMLLLSLQRYQQALNFIDSLGTSDFIYEYKKNTTYKSILALRYDSQGDKLSRDSIYRIIDNEIEKYVGDRNLSAKEFKAAYTELFAIKGMYLSPIQIDSSVDAHKKQYPDKSTFFEFFKPKAKGQ